MIRTIKLLKYPLIEFFFHNQLFLDAKFWKYYAFKIAIMTAKILYKNIIIDVLERDYQSLH